MVNVSKMQRAVQMWLPDTCPSVALSVPFHFSHICNSMYSSLNLCGLPFFQFKAKVEDSRHLHPWLLSSSEYLCTFPHCIRQNAVSHKQKYTQPKLVYTIKEIYI